MSNHHTSPDQFKTLAEHLNEEFQSELEKMSLWKNMDPAGIPINTGVSSSWTES
jgi:hypothetical protein